MSFHYNPVSGRMEDRPASCWRLAAGRWTERKIEGTSLELAELRHAPGIEIPCAVDGDEDRHWPSTQVLVAELASRIVPHCTWYCAPAFFACESPDRRWSGLALLVPDVVLLRTSLGERQAVVTAYHEAWHVLERYLTRAEREAVDAAIRAGGEWQGDYYNNHQERRARAFEHWSMHRHETGVEPRTGGVGRLLDAVHRWTLPAHEKVFAAAFDGTIGRRAAARRWVASSRLSPAAQSQAAADRQAAKQARQDRWIHAGSWAVIAGSAAMVLGGTVHHWLT